MAEEMQSIENPQESGETDIEKLVYQVEKNPKLRNLKAPVKSEIVRMFFSLEKSHSGPLPDIETLKGYNELITNGADRVMEMAETQLKHRIDIEKIVVTSQMKQSGKGQNYAFILGLTGIIGSVICIMFGHDTAGSVLGSASLVALVTAFIQGKNWQSKNLNNKKPS